MTIKKIGVVGAGTMGGGCGIAHLAAERGFEVVLYDTEQRFVNGAIKRITGLLERKIGKQKMTVAGKDAVLKRITTTTNMADFALVDLVIEAIFDDIETKKSAFKELDKICRAEIIFCSNTTSVSFTTLASVTNRPEMVIGLNFLKSSPDYAASGSYPGISYQR